MKLHCVSFSLNCTLCDTCRRCAHVSHFFLFAIFVAQGVNPFVLTFRANALARIGTYAKPSTLNPKAFVLTSRANALARIGPNLNPKP